MKNLFLIAAVALFFPVSSAWSYHGSPDETKIISFNHVNSGSKSVTLEITGMTCSGCASHVSTALSSVDGILEEEVMYPGNIAVIKYNPEKVSVEEIIAAIEKTGYKASIKIEGEKTQNTKAL